MSAIRSGVQAVVAAVFAMAASSVAFAGDAKTHIDIPAQDLARSLLALSAQTDVPIVANGETVEGVMAPAVSGLMSPGEALEILLAPSHLTFERDRETVFRVVKASDVTSVGATPVSAVAGLGRDEIIVTGTNIRTASNIRGAPADSAPLFTYSQDEVDASGYASTEEFIRVQPASFGGPRTNPFEFRVLPVFDNNNLPAGGRPIFDQPSLVDNGVSIHGLTPLTLVNGRRFRGDLASLPVSDIDRVEIFADGASAIYGDGAAPGVVNVILRDEIDGVETTARYGFVEDSGAEEYLAALTAGRIWDSGKAHATYEYLKRTNVTIFDRDYVSSRSALFDETPVGFPEHPLPEFVDILPGERHHKISARAEQSIADNVILYAEGFGSASRSRLALVFPRFGFPPLTTDFLEFHRSQYSSTVGATIDVSEKWQSDIAANRSASKILSTRKSLWSVRAKADGPLFGAPGGTAKLALGGEFRVETVESTSFRGNSVSRNIFSGFGEAFVPVVGPGNRRRGVERLELSMAGRFDHYQHSGGVFSPRASLLWAPIEGFSIRGSYGRSHEAPIVSESAQSVFVRTVDRPPPCGFTPPCFSPSVKPAIVLEGGKTNLPAARSENITIGADYSPAFIQGLNLSATYYDIDLTGQAVFAPLAIEPNLDVFFPDTNLRLITPAFAQMILPVVSELAQSNNLPFDDCIRVFPSPFLSTLTDVPIHDAGLFELPCVRLSDAVVSGDFSAINGVRQATGRTHTTGLDASVSYSFSGGVGTIDVFANANIVFTYQKQLSDASPRIEHVGTFGNPLDYRLRAGASWRFRGFSAAVTVNHADSYTYTLEPVWPFLIEEGQERVVPVAAMTTIDLNLAYNTGELAVAQLLRNLEFSIAAINVSDERPLALVATQRGFDDFNADPRGRFIAIQVKKRW